MNFNILNLAHLTTEITRPFQQQHVQTISELFAFPNKFTVGTGVQFVIASIPEYQQAVNEGRVKIAYKCSGECKNTIQIFGCDAITQLNEYSDHENFYLFPHKLYSVLTTHEMGFMNPYTEDFQNLTTRAYSAGLHRAWERILELQAFNISAGLDKKEESSLLTFEDLRRVCFIFPIGMITGFFVLLLEIFHHKFLDWKEKKKIIKVRRIEVRPINETEI